MQRSEKQNPQRGIKQVVMEKNEAILEMHPAEVGPLKTISICMFLRHNETSYWKKQLKIFGRRTQ